MVLIINIMTIIHNPISLRIHPIPRGFRIPGSLVGIIRRDATFCFGEPCIPDGRQRSGVPGPHPGNGSREGDGFPQGEGEVGGGV